MKRSVGYFILLALLVILPLAAFARTVVVAESAGAPPARAATYLLHASHIAAMPPGTNLGAATPVAIGIGGDSGKPPPADSADGKERAPAASSMEKKAMQDAAAYLRSLAQLRGRNAEWAEKAVREAESLSADGALKLKVVDFVATDLSDLLRQADGRSGKGGQGGHRDPR